MALVLCYYNSYTQTISGQVLNKKSEPLVGANVFWYQTNSGAITDTLGNFSISINANTNKLIASFVGHKPDTIIFLAEKNIVFKLSELKVLNEITIKTEKGGIRIDDKLAAKTEIISQTELRKAACCDLAGCFETQSTVQPQTTNVITNSKELRILGLSGVYNQVLIDGFPMVQGLTYTYGISTVPGSLVDNIYVAKGANSVLQGYESLSGQINVETKEPDKTDKLYLNGYINNFGEKHLNANYAIVKNNWSNLIGFHSVNSANKTDRDKDDFLDLPQLTRYAFSNKWKYRNETENGISTRIGIRYINERRIGGQTNFNFREHKGSSLVYGQFVQFQQPELWEKTRYRFNEKHSVVLFASTFYQNQDSYFGTIHYKAQQNNIYLNAQYELEYGANNNLKTGISYRYLNLQENIHFLDNFINRNYAGKYQRLEYIPGLFTENSLSLFENKLNWITGVRLDNHNQFGTQFTPRTLLKYDISEKTIVRASIGTGWRTVNLFSENIGLLVSSRDILITEQLKPEKAINSGINITHKYEKERASGYITFDYYHTNFQNQIFPDYDLNPQQAIIKNFTGTSISNGFQAEFSSKWWKTIEFKVGYNYLDVYRVENEKKAPLPFNSKHKLLGTFSYKPKSNQYHFDVNWHWYGQQRLPNTKSNPVAFQRPDYSNPYSILSTQFTYNFTKFKIYAGCENIFDFRQLQPIVSWQNPFSPYFDTSFVWGPTRGREIYLGIRFRIE